MAAEATIAFERRIVDDQTLSVYSDHHDVMVAGRLGASVVGKRRVTDESNDWIAPARLSDQIGYRPLSVFTVVADQALSRQASFLTDCLEHVQRHALIVARGSLKLVGRGAKLTGGRMDPVGIENHAERGWTAIRVLVRATIVLAPVWHVENESLTSTCSGDWLDAIVPGARN